MVSYLMTIMSMIVLHIIADYNLQGILAKLKSKQYWIDLFPTINNESSAANKYKNDYKIGLLMHSFEWAFFVMIPIFIHKVNIPIILIFILNVIIHYIVDDLKANELKINLIEDQFFHVAQIVITALIII